MSVGRRAIACAAAPWLLAAAAASAQTIDPARLAAADRLLEVVTRQGGSVPTATVPPFDMAGCMADALDHPGGIDCPQREREYRQVVAALAPQRPRIEAEVAAAMRQVYAREFTVAELDAIAAFYATPAGGHLLVRRPALDLELRAAQTQAALTALGTASSKGTP